ncbi:MAG: SUMF1/EgtB/PvdO family nonheme iron enzyme, partial [Ignavibacteria bacterium]
MMGSDNGDKDEKPVHRVEVSSFYMDKYEVTVGGFEKFINAAGYKTDAEKEGWSYVWTGSEFKAESGVNWRCGADGKPRSSGKKDYPVIHVSRNDAVAYAKWSNKRLPTEFALKGQNITAQGIRPVKD